MSQRLNFERNHSKLENHEICFPQKVAPFSMGQRKLQQLHKRLLFSICSSLRFVRHLELLRNLKWSRGASFFSVTGRGGVRKYGLLITRNDKMAGYLPIVCVFMNMRQNRYSWLMCALILFFWINWKVLPPSCCPKVGSSSCGQFDSYFVCVASKSVQYMIILSTTIFTCLTESNLL